MLQGLWLTIRYFKYPDWDERCGFDTHARTNVCIISQYLFRGWVVRYLNSVPTLSLIPKFSCSIWLKTCRFSWFPSLPSTLILTLSPSSFITSGIIIPACRSTLAVLELLEAVTVRLDGVCWSEDHDDNASNATNVSWNRSFFLDSYLRPKLWLMIKLGSITVFVVLSIYSISYSICYLCGDEASRGRSMRRQPPYSTNSKLLQHWRTLP